MSSDADDSLNRSSLLLSLEQQMRRLALEMQHNELTIKTTQESLNKSLKHNILLEHELETERLNKSMIQMELDSLKATMNKFNNRNSNNSGLDMNVLLNERECLTNKIYKIQTENMELKQALSSSNGQISTLIANQYKYSEKINSVISTMNSLQEQIRKLTEESNTIVNLISNCKILVKKTLIALEYSKKLKKSQNESIQHIMEELASTKSKMHMYINRSENPKIINTDQQNTILSNQTHLEICMALVGTLEAENNVLHKAVRQMSEERPKTSKDDDIDKYTEDSQDLRPNVSKQ